MLTRVVSGAFIFFWEHEENRTSIAGLELMADDAYAAQLQFQGVMTSLVPVMARFLDAIGIAPDDNIDGLATAIEKERLRLEADA